MGSRFVVIVAVAILFLLSGENVNACQCRKEVLDTEPKLEKAIAKELRVSKLVFSGKVIERNGEYLTFKVETIWKGEAKDEIIFTSKNYVTHQVGTNGAEEKEIFIDSCAYSFAVGESYLVYSDIENGRFEVSKCSRTQILSEAGRDIGTLNRLTKKNNLRASALDRMSIPLMAKSNKLIQPDPATAFLSSLSGLIQALCLYVMKGYDED